MFARVSTSIFKKSIFVLLLVVLSAYGSSQLAFLTAQENQYLAEHKYDAELVLGSEAPPNAFYDENGNYVGILPDYMTEVKKILGFEFRTKYVRSWQELIEYSKTAPNVILVGIARTDERNEYLNFTDSFLNIPYMVLCRQGSKVDSMKDLENLKVCTVDRYAVNEFLKRYYPDVETIKVSNYVEGVRGVSTGFYDAMVISQVYASYTIETQAITNLHFACETGYLNSLCVAVSKSNPILCSILQKTFAQIPEKKRKAIYRKWVHPAEEKVAKSIFIWTGVFTGALVLVAGLLCLWSISLRRQVSKQTNQLRKSKDKLEQIIKRLPMPMLISDKIGNIVLFNDKFTEIFGYTIEDVKNREQWLKAVYPDPDYRQKVVECWGQARAVAEGNNSDMEMQVYDMVAKDGSTHSVEFKMTISEDKCLLAMNDITERKEIEAERLKSQKLESLSTVAGGIAHDFNNLLTAVFGNIEIAQKSLAENTKSYQYLSVAHKAIESSKNLTKQLLTFAKGGEPMLEPIRIDKLIEDTVKFNLSGTNIELKLSMPDNLYHAIADEGLLFQVFANLTINARQAMPDGGTISVSAMNVEIEGKQYVRILFQDSGEGIPEELSDKIFDPYFTTKESGSGLGLAVCHSIIKKHNGTISVESTGRQGATFTVLLPASNESDFAEVSTSEIPQKTLPSELKVLLMDDDEMVREVGVALLESFGYCVDTAVNGEEAITKFDAAIKNGCGFDIVIMDLTIANGIGGIEAIKEVLAISEDAKVIVSSGYSDAPAMARYKDFGFSGRLAKPFDIDELEEEIIRVANL